MSLSVSDSELEVLNENPTLAEILWNFSRLKDERRLTLKQNPHFYTHLPLSSQAYGGRFKMEPIEDFLQGQRFYVLIDRPGHVYIETDGYSQCFGNAWRPNGAVVFKGGRVFVVAVLFFPPFLTPFQSLAGSWKVRPSSRRPSKAHPCGFVRRPRQPLRRAWAVVEDGPLSHCDVHVKTGNISLTVSLVLGL